MPKSEELMKLIRRGASPEEIMERFKMPPSRLRRMLRGKHLQERLRLAEDIAAEVVVHQTAAGVYDAARRLIELMASEKVETARKVGFALLSEGMQICQENDAADLRKAAPSPVRPADLLVPLDMQPPRAPAGRPARRPGKEKTPRTTRRKQ